MVRKSKYKKSSKKSKTKSANKKGVRKSNTILIYGASAAIAFAVIVMAFPSGNQKKAVNKTEIPAKEVRESKVSDIKQTKEVKLNIPKKKKAINSPSFNEKAVQIRFAEIDYNSNKKISLREYLYYFKDKSVGKKKFKLIDKNKDKSITYSEYLASKK
ncbi:MAG: hypothetical protein CBC96_02225 [Pelagibacteraceae bacterium TMED136]|nr:MAG: hypothetical protein CBC96_02225 [Pelagibacteraceae bacterium TMED136]|tara:strand:- start:1949 stop:2422 length:474 start_codon:yes stop_codon:yes gene_type:complete